MKKSFSLIFGLFLLAVFAQFGKANVATNPIDKTPPVQSKARGDKKTAVAETTRIVAEIVKDSFPELRQVRIFVKTFDSSADYFRSRFSLARFLTFRELHYIIFVNPQVFEKNAPAAAIRAIIAHELAHAAYYRRHNRFELLGMIGLETKSFAARFERGADLQAIKRGYGAGLKNYREWLYQNIPAHEIAAKKRNYFAPDEIDLILDAMKEKPEIIDYWIKRVPRDSAQIEADVKSQTESGK